MFLVIHVCLFVCDLSISILLLCDWFAVCPFFLFAFLGDVHISQFQFVDISIYLHLCLLTDSSMSTVYLYWITFFSFLWCFVGRNFFFSFLECQFMYIWTHIPIYFYCIVSIRLAVLWSCLGLPVENKEFKSNLENLCVAVQIVEFLEAQYWICYCLIFTLKWLLGPSGYSVPFWYCYRRDTNDLLSEHKTKNTQGWETHLARRDLNYWICIHEKDDMWAGWRPLNKGAADKVIQEQRGTRSNGLKFDQFRFR